MIIKVCGMRDAENIRKVERLGIDMMGFICWEGSPRHVAEVPAYLPRCPRVGVFVDPSMRFVRERVEAFGFSHVQLHGCESPEFCKEVGEQTKRQVIKAISLNTSEDLDAASRYEGCADLLLFDTKCPTCGGSGRKFCWDILSDYRGPLPFLLSGGIGPEDAERLRQFHHPKCIGLDINSRFEVAPGIKDIEAISRFIKSLSPALSKGEEEDK
mgnify:CR=1 FL=1